MHDYRSDIDMWADMWDEMSKSDIHPAIEKPQPSPFAADVLGNTPQDTYFDYFDSEDLLQETSAPKPVKPQRPQKPQRSQNPVYPDSVGRDDQQPQAVWVNESLLKEIESLKNRLFKLENKMARLGQGNKIAEKKVHGMFDKSLYAEIKSLRQRIDRVSNVLGVQDEPTPYQIKRD
jgi:hypothetical protein